MEHISNLANLYQTEYYLRVVNGLKLKCHGRGTFSCIGEPKKSNLILFLNNCTKTYTLLDGRIIRAESGTIVYISQNAQYTVSYEPVNPSLPSYHDEIEFQIWDNHQKPLIFTNSDVEIIHVPNFRRYQIFFSEIYTNCLHPIRSQAKLQSICYELLSEVGYCYCQKTISPQQFQLIEKGIRYLDDNKNQSLSVKEIAGLCNISECYFRRLFKQYTGMLPVEYKLQSKLSQARQFLISQNLSIQEVAELSGFEDAAYFCKVFKSKFGISPNDYRRSSCFAL